MEVLTSLILILELFLSLSLSLMEEPIPILITKHKQRWHHYGYYKNHRIKKGVIYLKDHSAIESRKSIQLKRINLPWYLEHIDLQGIRDFFK